jgi:hypothetical protein
MATCYYRSQPLSAVLLAEAFLQDVWPPAIPSPPQRYTIISTILVDEESTSVCYTVFRERLVAARWMYLARSSKGRLYRPHKATLLKET